MALEVLNVCGNEISELPVPAFRRLRRLQVLLLAQNRISDVLLAPSSYAYCTNVQYKCKHNRRTLRSSLVLKLHELTRLRETPCGGASASLVRLSVADNPCAALPHARLLLAFHLRSLHEIDGQPVSPPTFLLRFLPFLSSELPLFSGRYFLGAISCPLSTIEHFALFSNS